MIEDARTVAWKDLRELLLRRGSLRRGLIGALFPVVVFGLVLGVQPEGPFPVVAFLPVTAIAGIVVDAFAGERERHTLETLLATPASDRALLVGKLVSSVGYGWGVCLGAIAVGRLATALGPFDYPPELIAFDVLFTLVVSLVEGAMGVLVSLRSETVRQAGRTLGLINLGVLIVAGAGRAVTVAVGAVGGAASVLALALLAVTLMGAAEARFRRGRLLLD